MYYGVKCWNVVCNNKYYYKVLHWTWILCHIVINRYNTILYSFSERVQILLHNWPPVLKSNSYENQKMFNKSQIIDWQLLNAHFYSSCTLLFDVFCVCNVSISCHLTEINKTSNYYNKESEVILFLFSLFFLESFLFFLLI